MTRQSSLPHGASAAVAGSGIIGLSSAWRLAQSGWQVTVYDQADLSSEASWAGAGMLSPGGEVEADSPLAALAIESRQLYPEFIKEIKEASGAEIDYQECGSLELAYSSEELAALEGKGARQAALGIASKPVTANHIAQFWPRIQREGLAGARFYPGDALVNPRELLASLRIACERAGVVFRPHCAVTGAELSGDFIVVHNPPLLEKFDLIVIAAGAWSSSIEVSGVPLLPAVEPVRGHLIGYQQPEQTCSTILRHGETYLLQRANGLLVAGSSIENVGFDRELNPKIVGAIARKAGVLLPHLSETTHSEAWLGFRPASELLRLGAWYSPHFYLAYGHYRNGILLAPLTAQRLASEINANFEKR